MTLLLNAGSCGCVVCGVWCEQSFASFFYYSEFSFLNFYFVFSGYYFPYILLCCLSYT